MSLEDKLVNWGNWARTRRHYSHCLSIEHRWRSPQVWYPPGPRVEVDPVSALAVERTMRHIPYSHRLALKLVYVWKVPKRSARREVRVPYDLWDQFMWQAQHMVDTLLTFQKTSFRIRISTDLPPALLAPDGAGCNGEKNYATCFTKDSNMKNAPTPFRSSSRSSI